MSKTALDRYIALAETRRTLLDSVSSNLSLHLDIKATVTGSERNRQLFKVETKYGTLHTDSSSIQTLLDVSCEQAHEMLEESMRHMAVVNEKRAAGSESAGVSMRHHTDAAARLDWLRHTLDRMLSDS